MEDFKQDNIQLLYSSMSNDLISDINTCDITFPLLYQSEYQDILGTAYSMSPELSIMLNDFIYSYSTNSSHEFNSAAVYDSYRNNSDIEAQSSLFFGTQESFFLSGYVLLFTTLITLS
jgi:hypothetical protein